MQNTKDMMINLYEAFDLMIKHSDTMSKDDLITSLKMLHNLYNLVYEDYMFADHINNLAQLTEEEEISKTEASLHYENEGKTHEVY